jgi:hypothetical protein
MAKSKRSKFRKEVMHMQRVILAALVGLVAAGALKDAGAAPCCCGSTIDTGITEGNLGSVSGKTDYKAGDAVVGNRSAQAGREQTMGPCDPAVLENLDAKSRHSVSRPERAVSEAESPVKQD